MNVQSAQRRWTIPSGSGPAPDASPTPPDDDDAGAAPASASDADAEVRDHSGDGAPAPSAGTQAFDGLPPVSRFSRQAPGLVVERVGSAVVISGRMELHGTEATPERAASVERAINEAWTRSFPDGTSVSCHVSVQYRPLHSDPSPDATQIEAERTVQDSKAKDKTTVTLNANERDAFTWAPAHEFGHLLGLGELYSESVVSQIRGRFGLSRTTAPFPGYESNVMAATNGTVDGRNVVAIATENEPRILGNHDDDHMAAWVSARTPAELQKMPTAEKIRTIEALQAGWISDQDMTVMGRICASVTSHDEAQTIRGAVDLRQFTDLGQRTQMRVLLARMP